jgi:hypothetical protein
LSGGDPTSKLIRCLAAHLEEVEPEVRHVPASSR